MDKLLEFKDFPSTETPINAENLNKNFNFLGNENKTIDEKIEKINNNLQKISSKKLEVTKSVEEQILIQHNIEKGGTYLLLGNIPINYYGKSNRQIDIRLYINEENVDYTTTVLNINAYTVPRTLISINEILDNSNIKVGIKSSTDAEYSCGSFDLTILRLK